MRILMLAIAVLLAAPALGQSTETFTFEGGSPVAYKPDDRVPKAARVKTIVLSGGGKIRFRTQGGCKCVGLVTHMGTTSIVPLSRKGKIQPGRFVDIRLRKSPGARLDSIGLINAGTRLGDDPSTTAVETNFVLGYDSPGGAEYIVYDADAGQQPLGGTYSVVRAAPAPLDLTTSSLDFVRILIGGGEMTFDDIVVSFGN